MTPLDCDSASKLSHASSICLLLFVIGLLMQSLFVPSIIDDYFYSKIKTNINIIYGDKYDSDLHLFEYWLYNITNPYEASSGSIPQIQSIGPFTYKRLETKSNIRFTDDDTIVSYTYHYQFVFQPDKSTSISTNEYIWTISESMLGFFYFVNRIASNVTFFIPCVDEAIQSWPSIAIFHHNTIQNFIINGYSDPYINSTCSEFSLLWDTSGKLAIDGENNVVEYTGIDDIDKVRELLSYRNFSVPMTNPNILNPGYLWDSNETVEGSREIIQFPPANYVNTSSELIIWSSEKGRKIRYNFDKYVQYNTIPLLRFRMNDTELNNCTITPLNCDFYQFWKKGVFNLSTLRDTPRFLSKSKFLNASTYFIDQSMIRFGLNPPNPGIDDDTFDVDPITGLVFSKHHSYQSNIRMIKPLRPYPTNFDNIAFFGDLVPFTNIFIKGNISNQQTQLYLDTLNKMYIWRTLSIYAPILVVSVFIFGIFAFYKSKTKKRNQNQTISNTQQQRMRQQQQRGRGRGRSRGGGYTGNDSYARAANNYNNNNNNNNNNSNNGYR